MIQTTLTSFSKDHRINKRANIIMRPKPFSIIRKRTTTSFTLPVSGEINTDFQLTSSCCCQRQGVWRAGSPVNRRKGTRRWSSSRITPERGTTVLHCLSPHTTPGLTWQFLCTCQAARKGLKGERDPGPRKLVLLEEKEVKEAVVPGWWRILEEKLEDTARP